MSHYLLLNGPNLNLLGRREPGLYGSDTLESISRDLTERAVAAGHQLSAFQANSEGALIDRIHATPADGIDAALFNPGGYTHTSVALRDALLGVALTFVEVHLSNIAARESFRATSYFSDIALGTVCGFGAHGYVMALDGLMQRDASTSADVFST